MRRDEALCTQGGIEAGVLPLMGVKLTLWKDQLRLTMKPHPCHIHKAVYIIISIYSHDKLLISSSLYD